MKKCTGGGGGGREWKKMKIDRQEQKEEQMRPQPSAYSCFLSLTVQILTLHSNPITLPNWIGCARCSDRIKASIPPTRRWREPCGPQSSILENGPSGSCATINRNGKKKTRDVQMTLSSVAIYPPLDILYASAPWQQLWTKRKCPPMSTAATAVNF